MAYFAAGRQPFLTILLLDPDPRQLLPLARELVTAPG
jgi:hypothetical protein